MDTVDPTLLVAVKFWRPSTAGFSPTILCCLPCVTVMFRPDDWEPFLHYLDCLSEDNMSGAFCKQEHTKSEGCNLTNLTDELGVGAKTLSM
ncbi:hypothetical protein EJ110_NYTH40555 [Nymphaea thermarum]|nr:hypothetical protein EJ110_NYTH40555 [Nymphaea thermarum]